MPRPHLVLNTVGRCCHLLQSEQQQKPLNISCWYFKRQTLTKTKKKICILLSLDDSTGGDDAAVAAAAAVVVASANAPCRCISVDEVAEVRGQEETVFGLSLPRDVGAGGGFSSCEEVGRTRW